MNELDTLFEHVTTIRDLLVDQNKKIDKTIELLEKYNETQALELDYESSTNE